MVEIWRRILAGRHQPKNETAQNGNARCEGQGHKVQVHVTIIEQVTADSIGYLSFNPAHPPKPKESAGNSATEKQQQRFCQKLLHQSPSCCSQSCAHSELPVTVCRASKH